MNDENNVDKIMADITASIDQAEQSQPAPDPASLEEENNLYASLSMANKEYTIAAPQGSGLKNMLRKKLFALLADTFEQIAAFHVHSLRVMNKLTKALDGTDDELSGQLLTKTKNRMDLTEHLAHRVAQLEERLAKLESKDTP